MKITSRIAVTVIISYAVLCVSFYLFQDRFIYHHIPAAARQGAESLRVKSGDAVLNVWVLHPGLHQAVIYFGGNRDDVGAKLSVFSETFPDQTVYLVNYRGYGGSTGKPSEAALIGDAQTIYDWAALRHDRISVMGRSLGTGVATALAASRPVERLILITPYDSLSNVVADDVPWLPVSWLLRDHYNSAARITDVHAPVMVMIAGRDSVILRPRSDALCAAIPAALRSTVVISGATHDDLPLFLGYLQSHASP
jgi:pimeloyl-ACP methyl ester carboxylesterase